jgi:exosortase A-associated hydrolase 2
MLWGIRLGALMALDLSSTERAIDRIVLWQPVVSGKSFLTQFLRIRIAAEFGEEDGAKGTDELRQSFRDERPVDVAGYEISPRLGRELDDKKLSLFLSRSDLRIDWFEVLSSESASPPRAQSQAIQECRDAGLRLQLHEMRGPAFWQLHERTVAPELIVATTLALERQPA